MAVKKARRKNAAAVLRSLNTIRRANLLSLIGEDKPYPSQNQLANALDVDKSYLSQIAGANPTRRFTEVVARRFEYKLRLDTGWLDVDRAKG